MAGVLVPILTSLYVADATKKSQAHLMADLQRHVNAGDQHDVLSRMMGGLCLRTLAALSSGSLAELQALRGLDGEVAAAIAKERRDVESHGDAGERTVLMDLERLARVRMVIAGASARAEQAIAAGNAAGAAAEVPVIQGAHRAALESIVALRHTSRQGLVRHLQRAHVETRRLNMFEDALFVVFLLALAGVVLRARRTFLEQMDERERQQRVEELLRRNDVLEQALAGIATFGKESGLTWVNRTFAEITGYEPQELIGMPIAAFLRKEDLHLVEVVEAELRQKGRVERELRTVRKDGTVAHLHLVLVARREDECFAFVNDVTAEKEALTSLREMNERFEQAMRATRDVVFDWDLKANRGWNSDAIYTDYGYSRDADPSDWWIYSIHPDDLERVGAKVTEAITNGADSTADEYRLRRHDGTWVPVYHRISIVRDESGVARRLVGAITDVSEHRKMLDELERLSMQNRMILAAAGEGILGVDIEGRTTFANPTVTALLGWTPDDLLGKPLAAILHADPLSVAGTANGKTAYRKKDGTSISVEFSSQPMADQSGAIAGAVVTFRDITARVAVEQMKDEFISIVSHELRTPLTSIRGALGLVAGGRAGAVPEKMSRMLDIAVANTDRLVRLINDILDLERIDSGKVTLARQLCAANVLIEDAVEPLKPLAAQAGVQLECAASSGVLFADRDRMLQTLTNLIGNAIKFSPRGGTVRVSAWTEDRNVRFMVEDQGRGIPQDKLKTIFERFQQVDATDSREKGGTGLGLAICRSIVDQHGGEIWAESDGSSGSRFLFTLPRVQLATSTANVQRRGTIVVCEDDPVLREVEIELLEAAGYRAVGFADGASLLGDAAVATADAILLDIGLPGIDGHEVLARLKAQPETRDIAVIIVSGQPVQDCHAAAAWLAKPVDACQLLRDVEAAVQRGTSHARVLVVEDDTDLARVIVESFHRLGVSAVHAATGREAIELASLFTPELMILDLVLPDIDGFGVVDYLKEHDLLTRIPLLVYSATEPTPEERERLRLGPTEFLVKSRVSPEDFERHVIRLLDAMVAGRREVSHVA